MEGVGESHFAIMVMMAVTLSVCRDVNELRPGPLVRKTTQQAVGESLAIVQKPLEGNPLGNRPVIKKDVDRPARRQLDGVCAARVDAIPAHINPFTPVLAPHTSCLPRGQDREGNSMLCENFECFEVDCRFREPHSFGFALES